MYDIFFIGDQNLYLEQWQQLKTSYPTIKNSKTLDEAKQKCFTKFFWVIWPDINIVDDFKFDYTVDDWSTDYVHVFKNKNTYDGVCLVPKTADVTDRELQYRFFRNKKEVDIIASTPKPYQRFDIKDYKDYLDACSKCVTKMFWYVPDDVVDEYEFDYYVPIYDQYHLNIPHVFLNGTKYDGICLLPAGKIVTEDEFNFRLFNEKKEVDILASTPKPYEKIYISDYDDLIQKLDSATSEFVWLITDDLDVTFDFDYQIPYYDKDTVYIFKNKDYYDGVILANKNIDISKREFEHKFFAKRKEIDIVASSPKQYDTVFISYQETNADKNYKELLKKVPNAKRVHGVKGIHQAHIEAAKKCNTPMIWIVDADACIVDDFNFDYQVPAWQHNHVHVWRSKNPINDLVYGYGGIKLFPRDQTENMDTSKPDMTTSISDKFIAVKEISNITEFNTGPFETWKSAFRECCKLSSKVIDRQKDKETEDRLDIWCTVGADRLYGEYAIAGAKLGRKYGEKYKDSPQDLRRINDFEWLKEQFNVDTQQ